MRDERGHSIWQGWAVVETAVDSFRPHLFVSLMVIHHGDDVRSSRDFEMAWGGRMCFGCVSRIFGGVVTFPTDRDRSLGEH